VSRHGDGADDRLLIAFITWFGGHTLYNRFHLKRRGLEQFPIPRSTISLPKSPFNRSDTGRSFWRRSQRPGYSNVRAEEYDGEEDGFAGRFSLEDDDEDAEDLTGQGLGAERDAWRGAQGGNVQQGKVGVHQGLVDV
jgi:cation-dependent mannose-6-phosphate receptor